MSEWQPMETIPDDFRDGRPIFVLPWKSDDPVVAAWRDGEWVPISEGRRVIEYVSDLSGTTYTDVTPEYWCPVPDSRHLPL